VNKSKNNNKNNKIFYIYNNGHKTLDIESVNIHFITCSKTLTQAIVRPQNKQTNKNKTNKKYTKTYQEWVKVKKINKFYVIFAVKYLVAIY